MACAGEITIPVTSRRSETRWLVSARYDSFFFIGSCVFTLLFYVFYRQANRMGWLLGGDQILITYFVFTAFFDHPHIFQTFSRTHGDPVEFHRRKALHTWGLGAFLIAGTAVAALRLEAEMIVFAAIYGSWHIIRQHYAFLKMYKALNRDTAALDNWLDYGLFYSGMFACFTYDYSELDGPIRIYGDLAVAFPTIPGDLATCLWTVFMVSLVGTGIRQIWRIGAGEPVNTPKLLLLAASLGTHYFVFYATATPFLVAEALETAYHDIQYQGWIRHYQQRREPLRRWIGRWALAAALYGLIAGAIELFGLMRPGWSWLFVPFTTLVIWHYYVDGLIWKVSVDPELRELTRQGSSRPDGAGAPVQSP